jgi:hypothetical protein
MSREIQLFARYAGPAMAQIRKLVLDRDPRFIFAAKLHELLSIAGVDLTLLASNDSRYRVRETPLWIYRDPTYPLTVQLQVYQPKQVRPAWPEPFWRGIYVVAGEFLEEASPWYSDDHYTVLRGPGDLRLDTDKPVVAQLRNISDRPGVLLGFFFCDWPPSLVADLDENRRLSRGL